MNSREEQDNRWSKLPPDVQKLFAEISEQHKLGIDVMSMINDYFGEHNINPLHNVYTWADIVKLYQDNIASNIITKAYTGYNDLLVSLTDNKPPKFLCDKILATYQIGVLIEYCYGGHITKEEWSNPNIPKYTVCYDIKADIFYPDTYQSEQKRFVAFHTAEQRNMFVSLQENTELLKMYFNS